MISAQRTLALKAYGQRITERRVARDVRYVRQIIDDGYNVWPELRDAIKLPTAVLALPANVERFTTLVDTLRGEMA